MPKQEPLFVVQTKGDYAISVTHVLTNETIYVKYQTGYSLAPWQWAGISGAKYEHNNLAIAIDQVKTLLQENYAGKLRREKGLIEAKNEIKKVLDGITEHTSPRTRVVRG